jgi:hypothetical protein
MFAVRTAADELRTDGWIATAETGSGGTRIGVACDNVFLGILPPDLPHERSQGIVLTRRAQDAATGAPDFALYPENLLDLLGDAGIRRVREAAAAHRAGLQLAAVNLIGTANECAWYSVGESLRQHSDDLANALDAEWTATVIERAAQVLSSRLKLRDRNDVAATLSHAHHLRNLRNDALHPRTSTRDEAEPAYTDVGAAQLLETTRRYLLRLNDLWSDARG